MPLWTGGLACALAIAVVSVKEFAPESAGGKDQGHVAFGVDPSAAYSVDVEIIPGADGAEICGTDRGEGHVEFSADDSAETASERGNGHVDFRVAVRPDGGVAVNGEYLAASDPTRGCRISLTWFPGAGTIAVQVVDAAGAVRAGQYAMACPPDRVHVTAAEILSLAVKQ